MEILAGAFVYLLAAIVAVPIAHKLGLGSVLGYLIAGVLIGPVFGIVGNEAIELQHFAEFGVVMMLFLVGLELEPQTLWKMRFQLLGLGGLQVVVTSSLIAGLAWALGLTPSSAITLGMILSLSSTAIVLQTLNEKGWLGSVGGQSSFSVLLTQDIAVIPMLAIIPLLGHAEASAGHYHEPWISTLEPSWQVGVILAAVGLIVVGGRFLMRPIFRFIASAQLREIFTAAALFLVIAIALLMDKVGLSPALGTFLAGVVLSGSEYRHELESDIFPFKGLLLGLFFLTVGAGINFEVLAQQPFTVFGLAIGLMVLKTGVLAGLGWGFGMKRGDPWLFSLGLSQAGEFAFVLFGFAGASGVLAAGLLQTMTLVVAITMLATPWVFIAFEKWVMPKMAESTDERPADVIEERHPVVVAGMGRFGQVVTRLLTTHGFKTTVLELNPQTIENLNKVGFKTHYGDATRVELLETAGLAQASLFIAAIDERNKQTEMVSHVRQAYPQVRILARAHDRHHVYELEKAGADYVDRELFEGSLNLATEALISLGVHPFRAQMQARKFRRHDQKVLNEMRETFLKEGFNRSYVDAIRKHSQDLFAIMKLDSDTQTRDESGWLPPPKGDANL